MGGGRVMESSLDHSKLLYKVGMCLSTTLFFYRCGVQMSSAIVIKSCDLIYQLYVPTVKSLIYQLLLEAMCSFRIPADHQDTGVIIGKPIAKYGILSSIFLCKPLKDNRFFQSNMMPLMPLDRRVSLHH